MRTAGIAASAALGDAAFANGACRPDPPVPDGRVRLYGDGIGLGPGVYAELLARLCAGREVTADDYLLGGEVEAFEQHMAALLGDLYHVRRMFGGNLFQGWAAAHVARHYADGFVKRLGSAVAVAESFFELLAEQPGVRIERIPDGTNVARLELRAGDPVAVAARLAGQGILLGDGRDGGFTLAVNETWNRTGGPALAEAFAAALG